MQRYSFKNFLPLIIIFSIIILTTIVVTAFENSWEMSAVMTNFMGIFFIIFALFKIVNLSAFAQAYAEYDLLAQKSSAYAHLYPFIELALGILYLFNFKPFATNLFTLILMLISALGVAIALSKKREIECACLGTVFKIPMTYVTLAEDLTMAAMALYMLVLHI